MAGDPEAVEAARALARLLGMEPIEVSDRRLYHAAAVLAGSLVPTTLAGHPYWRVEDPAMRRQQRVHFFKNVGLFGGALLVLSERRRR